MTDRYAPQYLELPLPMPPPPKSERVEKKQERGFTILGEDDEDDMIVVPMFPRQTGK